jgi:hypothetical protein
MKRCSKKKIKSLLSPLARWIPMNLTLRTSIGYSILSYSLAREEIFLSMKTFSQTILWTCDA